MTDRTANALIAAILLVMGLAMIMLAPKAHAQDSDTFVPIGMRSSCEWYHGEACKRWRDLHGRRLVPRRHALGPRALDMDVLALQVRLKERGCLIEADGIMGEETRRCLARLGPGGAAYGLPRSTSGIALPPVYVDRVPDRMPTPRERIAEDDYETLGSDGCVLKWIKMSTDPKLYKDANAEAIRRWQGLVTSKKGEVWADWRNAKKMRGDKNGIVCWRASTGERATDGKEGNHQRCEARGRPCRGDRPGDADRARGDDGEDREDAIDDGARVYIVPPTTVIPR